jgi:hypothetical protein
MVPRRFVILAIALILIMVSTNSFADLPPDPGGDPGGPPVGGGAPLDGGLIISIIMAALYGFRKRFMKKIFE